MKHLKKIFESKSFEEAVDEVEDLFIELMDEGEGIVKKKIVERAKTVNFDVDIKFDFKPGSNANKIEFNDRGMALRGIGQGGGGSLGEMEELQMRFEEYSNRFNLLSKILKKLTGKGYRFDIYKGYDTMSFRITVHIKN